MDLVSQKISYFDERYNAQKSHRRSLLDDYILNPKLDLPDIVGMACDLLLAGVDTVCIMISQIYFLNLLAQKLFYLKNLFPFFSLNNCLNQMK